MKLYLTIGVAVVAAALALFLLARPRAEETPRADVAAGPPARESPVEAPADDTKAVEAPPAPEPVKEPSPSLSGIVRDEKDGAVPFAQVILAFHPPEDNPIRNDYLGADYLQRSRSRATLADANGAFAFEDLALSGKATVAAFKDGCAGVSQQIDVQAGKPLEGVEVKIVFGKALRGIVVEPDGAPVGDAIVSIYHAWHAKDMAWSSSMALTDAQGRFELGFSPNATVCNLRVNSVSLGQDFFLQVPVGEDEVRLTWKGRASLEGRIAWEDGSPAAEVLVYLSAEVPEPKIPIWYSGMRPRMTVEAPLDADGRYEIHDLQPGFEWEALIVNAGPDRLLARLHPLTPRMKTHFTLAPGETKTWDETIARPIVLHGTVRTERAGTPIARARIGLRKDGKAIEDFSAEADAQGAYEMFINSGPGRYVVFAKPRFAEGWDNACDAIAEKFGKALDLKGGDTIEADLQVFEPIVMPVRVIDCDGKPVRSIRYELGFQATNGRRFGCGDSAELDGEGRTSLSLHFPVRELTLQVSGFPGGPKSEVRHFQAEPGTALPEETFTLERTCSLTAVLADPAGVPQAEAHFTVEAVYADGTEDSFGVRTDKTGAFKSDGLLRATTVTLTIHGDAGSWKSALLDAATGATLELGNITIDTSKLGAQE